MDIGEKGIGVLSPLPDALLQALDRGPVNPVVIYDVTAEWPIQKGNRNFCMRACLFGTAFSIGRNALDGFREASISQDCRKPSAEGDVASSAVVPGNEQFVQPLQRV